MCVCVLCVCVCLYDGDHCIHPHAHLLLGSGRSEMSGVKVDPRFPYVSAAVMQGGTADRILGVSQLRLCRANGKWQKKVQICSELFSTATNSTRVGRRNSVQGDSCSFGYFEFNLEEEMPLPPRPTPDPCRPKRE